jgi:pimeloyl-ACP methyl ester carboxylesterase
MGLTDTSVSEPTLVLVHGAWHGPWVWDALTRELPGVNIRAVALTSSGHDPAALGDMYADAALIREAVEEIGGPVVVAAHSYGGVPTTQGLAGVSQVRRLVYVASFQLEVGDSLMSAAGGTSPDWFDVHETDGYLDPLRPKEIFYGDVDDVTTRESMARLGHQSWPAINQPLTRAAWHTIPSTYVVCEQDAAVPVPAQEAMAQRSGRVLRLDTSHSPFLSRPAEVAAILKDELSAATG